MSSLAESKAMTYHIAEALADSLSLVNQTVTLARETLAGPRRSFFVPSLISSEPS